FLACVQRGGGTMIIIDTALKKRAAEGKPIQVGMIGAGFMGRGLANQIIHSTPGMRLAAVFNRNLEGASRAYAEAGASEVIQVNSGRALDDAIAAGKYAITDDPEILCDAERIDAIVEV